MYTKGKQSTTLMNTNRLSIEVRNISSKPLVTQLLVLLKLELSYFRNSIDKIAWNLEIKLREGEDNQLFTNMWVWGS